MSWLAFASTQTRELPRIHNRDATHVRASRRCWVVFAAWPARVLGARPKEASLVPRQQPPAASADGFDELQAVFHSGTRHAIKHRKVEPVLRDDEHDGTGTRAGS
jgi:hypothetical protein